MSAPAFRENLIGIALISACNLLFLINDTLMKLANADLPLGEVIFFRGLLATVLLTPIVIATGGHRHLALLVNRPVFLRMVTEVLAAYTYLFALFHIPIANANTIGQTVPLMITAAGALFLGEAVGWRRWTAILVGFIGVLIIVRPGFAGFTGYGLVALVAAGFITIRDMTARFAPARLPTLLVALLTAAVVGATGPVAAVLFGEMWVVPSPLGFGQVVAAAVFVIGGYLTAFAFMRHGEISVVAPFRYTVILWAIIMGFFVWNEVPDWPMLIGMAVIAASGIYTFVRERNQARLALKAAAGEGM